jgi:hypothetical protein
MPVMTSATTPGGWAVTASTEYNSGAAGWYAVRTPLAYNGWLTDGSALPQWLAVSLPRPYVVAAYQLIPWWADNFPGRTPTAWTLEGSNDGTTWYVLDTRTGITWGSATAIRGFPVASPVTPYTRFRIYISANGGNAYTGLGWFQLIGRRF